MSFGFGPAFATPVEHVRAGFQQVRQGLKLPWFTAGKLYAAFLPAHRSGDPRAEFRAVQCVLSGRAWSWPWLETCAAEFDQLGIWPIAWSESGIERPLVWDRIPDDLRCRALALHLASAAYGARDVAQIGAAFRVVGGHLALTAGDSRCLAARHCAALWGPSVEAGDLSHFPPYFPGDSCRLSWLPRRR